MKEIKLIGVNGSIRKDSYNRLLLQNIGFLLPDNVKMEIIEIKDVPIYNPDDENNLPTIVRDYKEKIRKSDAVIIATPEYNFSFPGVLKNALDWFTRPPNDNVLKNKIAGIVSASSGMLGGSRAQYQLRQVLLYSEMDVLSKPEIFISFADKKFSPEGRIIDETSLSLINAFISNLVNKINKI